MRKEMLRHSRGSLIQVCRLWIMLIFYDNYPSCLCGTQKLNKLLCVFCIIELTLLKDSVQQL